MLGGTNDFNNGQRSNVIYKSLQKVWDAALKHDTIVLAMTVLDCGTTPEPVNDDRDALNRKVLAHEQKGV